MNLLDTLLCISNMLATRKSSPREIRICFFAPILIMDLISTNALSLMHLLFYSTMILFNTRTNQEFEQYHSLQYLDSFLPDDDMERVRKSAKILSDKSLRGKLLNASARDYAQREINYYNSIACPPILGLMKWIYFYYRCLIIRNFGFRSISNTQRRAKHILVVSDSTVITYKL